MITGITFRLADGTSHIVNSRPSSNAEGDRTGEELAIVSVDVQFYDGTIATYGAAYPKDLSAEEVQNASLEETKLDAHDSLE